MDKFESKVIVSGIGLSAIGRSIDRSGTDLVLDAALDAIADAGLQPNDIDGLASMPFGDRPPEEIADALGLQLDWMGGASSGAQLGVIRAHRHRSANMFEGLLHRAAHFPVGQMNVSHRMRAARGIRMQRSLQRELHIRQRRTARKPFAHRRVEPPA